jgi:hypothetical protein
VIPNLSLEWKTFQDVTRRSSAESKNFILPFLCQSVDRLFEYGLHTPLTAIAICCIYELNDSISQFSQEKKIMIYLLPWLRVGSLVVVTFSCISSKCNHLELIPPPSSVTKKQVPRVRTSA